VARLLQLRAGQAAGSAAAPAQEAESVALRGALQEGSTSSSRVELSSVASSGQPRWCRYPGSGWSPMCHGSRCRCYGYCRTVRPVDWGWDPNCCGCYKGRLDHSTRGKGGAYAQVEASLEESIGNSSEEPLVDQAVNGTAPTVGEDVAALLLSLYPEAPPEESSANSSEMLSVSQLAEESTSGSLVGLSAVGGRQPRWCRYPGAWWSPLCHGASCRCYQYCGWQRSVDWGWDPNCCGCYGRGRWHGAYAQVEASPEGSSVNLSEVLSVSQAAEAPALAAVDAPSLLP
jgi:hypothetical protein